MKIKHYLLLFFCLFLGSSSFSQNKFLPGFDFSALDNFILKKKIDGRFKSINVDEFSNIIALSEGGQLIKMNEKGDRLAQFNDVKKYGIPAYVDVSNPLQILVFYKSAGTAIVLDKMLTEQHVLDFRKQAGLNADLIATALDNNYWVFNKRDCNLFKIDALFNILFQGDDLRAYLNKVPQPQKIFTQTNAFYLYDSQLGLFQFDRYGNYNKMIPLVNWSTAQLIDNYFIGWTESECHVFDLTSQEEKVYTIPKTFAGAKSIIYINQKLFILKETGVEIYSNSP